jgi:hypothetical protein
MALSGPRLNPKHPAHALGWSAISQPGARASWSSIERSNRSREETQVRSKDSPRDCVCRGRDVEFQKPKIHPLQESRRMFYRAADA